MKVTIVIPTYWRGPVKEAPLCTLESDYAYDHATSLDTDGTLARALESLGNLQGEDDFVVAVVAACTRQEIKQAVELKVQSIVARFDYDFPFLMIGPDELVLWRRRLAAAGFPQYDEFLNLDGYSNIRNMCLLAAILTRADVAVLFDDDQVYEDPDYLQKALEHIGREHDGRFVAGLAGWYAREDGDYRLPAPRERWQRQWGGVKAMNEAFGLIDSEPRLKETTFVFGGNMVIHRSLFETIPFDPRIPRGEDIDYLINARLFGFHFFLDSDLWIRHLPPPKCAPEWFRLRQDIIRFSRERAKLATQQEGPGLVHVEAEELDPYPGRFLRDDFVDIVIGTSLEMATAYLARGQDRDAQECMVNIAIAKAENRIQDDPFNEYLEFQQRWAEFVQLAPEIKIWSPPSGTD